MAPLIERNTTIPTRRTQVFSTASDNQSTVEIKIYQGERALATDNKLLATFELTGIKPAPRAVPQIEVAFDIDADGLLHVEAKDKNTGQTQSITVRPSSGLSDDDIASMVSDAENNRQADEERREHIALINQADGVLYSAERRVREAGESIPGELRDRIADHSTALRQTLNEEGTAPDLIRQAINALADDLTELAVLTAEKTEEPKPEDTDSPDGATEEPENRPDEVGV